MADASGPSGGGYDYVQDSTNEPPNPRQGQEWYQPDTDDVKTYDGGTWVDVKISDHGQLSGVSEADHHQPVTVNAPISRSGQLLALAYGNGLTLDGSDQLALDPGNGLSIDGNGRIYIPADYATATELSNHANASDNPHNVTDDQTGAASALSNHASDSTSHHSKPTETQGSGTVTDTVEIAHINLHQADGWVAEDVYCYINGQVSARANSAGGNWGVRLYGPSGLVQEFSDSNPTVTVSAYIQRVEGDIGGIGGGEVWVDAELPTGDSHIHPI